MLNLELSGDDQHFVGFFQPSLSPTENYKRVLTSDLVLREAARRAGEAEDDFRPSIKLIDQTNLIEVELSAGDPALAQRGMQASGRIPRRAGRTAGRRSGEGEARTRADCRAGSQGRCRADGAAGFPGGDGPCVAEVRGPGERAGPANQRARAPGPAGRGGASTGRLASSLDITLPQARMAMAEGGSRVPGTADPLCRRRDRPCPDGRDFGRSAWRDGRTFRRTRLARRAGGQAQASRAAGRRSCPCGPGRVRHARKPVRRADGAGCRARPMARRWPNCAVAEQNAESQEQVERASRLASRCAIFAWPRRCSVPHWQGWTRTSPILSPAIRWSRRWRRPRFRVRHRHPARARDCGRVRCQPAHPGILLIW